MAFPCGTKRCECASIATQIIANIPPKRNEDLLDFFILEPSHLSFRVLHGLRPTNGDESRQPVIPSAARNLLLLFFTQNEIPRRSPADLLRMTGLGYTLPVEKHD